MKDGQASVTARHVAAQRLTFDRVPWGSGNPDADDSLARDVAGEGAASPGPTTDGMTPYLAARTAFFDRVVVRAIEAGITQVIVLAAGYDGRSLRYATDGVSWFEVDHPSTQADKLERLARLGIDPPATTFVAVDFTVDDVAAALDGVGHDATRPTLVLCEGVAVYLDLDVLERLLLATRSRAAAGSRLAISLSVATSDTSAERRRQFQTAVAAVGEPARSVLTADDAAELFTRTGWAPVAATEGADRARAVGFVLAEPI